MRRPDGPGIDPRRLASYGFVAGMVLAPFLALIYGWNAGLAVMLFALAATTYLAYDAYRARGSDLQAERALAKAAALHPDNCDVLMAQRELARERSQVAREDELTAALTRCPGTLGLRAGLAQQRQRIPEAVTLYVSRLHPKGARYEPLARAPLGR